MSQSEPCDDSLCGYEKGHRPRSDLLLEEYKLCHQEAQHLEDTIWKTSAAIGIGTLGPVVYAVFSASVSKLAADALGGLTIVGAIAVSACWIWWLAARRWWDIQHTMYARMRHIEEDLDLYRVRYVHYRDGNGDVSKSGLGDDRKKEASPTPTFRRRGVQKVMKWFPRLITAGWVSFLGWAFIRRIGSEVPPMPGWMSYVFRDSWFVAVVAVVGGLFGLLFGYSIGKIAAFRMSGQEKSARSERESLAKKGDPDRT